MHRGVCSLHPCLDHQHSVCLYLTSIRLALSQWFWMRDATVDKMLCSHVDLTLSVFNWTFMATVLRSSGEWFYCHNQQLYVFHKEWECHCLELMFIHFILYLTRYLYFLFNDRHKFQHESWPACLFSSVPPDSLSLALTPRSWTLG